MFDNTRLFEYIGNMEQQDNAPLPSSLSIQQGKTNKALLPILVSVLITAVLAGGGMFFWQQNTYKKQVLDLENQLGQVRNDNTTLRAKMEDLENVASEAAAEKEEIEKKACKGVWKDGVCVKSTCVDSDVNEKPDDIYIKGKVTYTDENGVETIVYDECSGSKTQVNEMWCYESPAGSGNYVRGRMVYDCDNGCLDGACIK